MKLAKLLSAEQIILDMKAREHWPAIVELVDHLMQGQKLPGELRLQILEALKVREELVSTGIGSGVAIPHAFSSNIEQVVAIFGRSKDGINFESVDHAPVHLIVLFIVPQQNYQLHLRTLSAIAKLFTNAAIRLELAAAKTCEEVLAILDSKPLRRPAPGA